MMAAPKPNGACPAGVQHNKSVLFMTTKLPAVHNGNARVPSGRPPGGGGGLAVTERSCPLGASPTQRHRRQLAFMLSMVQDVEMLPSRAVEETWAPLMN